MSKTTKKVTTKPNQKVETWVPGSMDFGSPQKIYPGYHLAPISKGTLGELSKVKEEIQELEDAIMQDSKILAGHELSDLYGALEAYASKTFNLTMDDLKKMSDITKRAFKNGHR